jgi:RimJ/RimL family protein N-acetyltransferase
MLTSFIEFIHNKSPECEIVALIHKDNIASYKLLEKLKFNNEGFNQELDSIVFSKYTH